MMKKVFLWIAVAFALPLAAAENNAAPVPGTVWNHFRNSLVEVVYHLQYSPTGKAVNALGLFCGNCNIFHDNAPGDVQADNRELVAMGYLVSPNQVIAPDLMIDAVGFAGVSVRLNGKTVPAEITALYPEQGALLLTAAQSVPGGVPLEFVKAEKGEKFFAYSRIMELGRWVQRVNPLSVPRSSIQLEGSKPASTIPGNSLIINSKNQPVALFANNNELPENIAWDLPWQQWSKLPLAEFKALQSNLARRLDKGMVPATIIFSGQELSRREKLAGINPPTEFFAYVFKMPDGKVLLPLLGTPRQHTLIEKVIVHLSNADVETVPEKAMKHYGVIQLKWKPEWLLSPIAPRCADMAENAGNMVLRADVNIYANKLDVTLNSDALGGVVRSYNNVLSGMVIKQGLPEMIFTLSGELLGLNLDIRAFGYSRKIPFTDAATFSNMLNDPEQNLAYAKLCNPRNAVGFLGVEYQVMNRDLARSMAISHLTNYGSEGLLVSHVFPGSPADRLGLKINDVLLKIVIPGTGAPIALTAKKFAHPQEQQFPWQSLDRIPEQYFSEIPEPWKGIKNPLNEQLSNIGIGKKIELIAIMQGKVRKLPLTVEQAPVNYAVAPRFKSAALGLEVRDVTFELRRYFRMNSAQPGVIVADVAAGSSASTAGLRPFEIITAVNDQPIKNVEDFRRAVSNQSEVRLAVRRLAAGRVVTVKSAVGPRR